MSLQVINGIKLGSKHFLQSPTDDLESLFYASLSAIFCNQHISKDLSPIEADMKSYLLSGNGRETGLAEYLYTSVNDLTIQPVIEAQPVMDEWDRELSEIYYDIKKRANIHVVLTKDAVDCQWRRSVGWILCAVSGDLKILRIINSHEGVLKEYQPFVR